MLDLLRQADVFLLPSLSEGCSLALAEAMASGIPVIGSNVGGVPEVMGELGADWLVGPHDVVGWLRRLHVERRRRLGRDLQRLGVDGKRILAIMGNR